jgi:hypothetical protein
LSVILVFIPIASSLDENSIALPLALVIIAMLQNGTDVNLVTVVVDNGDQPVIVLLDVEDGEFLHGVGVGEVARVS